MKMEKGSSVSSMCCKYIEHRVRDARRQRAGELVSRHRGLEHEWVSVCRPESRPRFYGEVDGDEGWFMLYFEKDGRGNHFDLI